MDLRLESSLPSDYLRELPPVVGWRSPLVQAKVAWIAGRAASKAERAKLAFEVARDEVAHSFDTGNPAVAIAAEETLRDGNGICFAKAHLLAALLRGLGIPCGFCYQRVLRKGTVESGYALHGLNAVYLEGPGWFRVDPRGNKPGPPAIDAQFSIAPERLAYPIRPELGEVDYPEVFVAPLPSVLAAMRASKDSQDLFTRRPEAL